MKRAAEREKGRKKFGGNSKGGKSKKIHPAGRSSADPKGSSEQAKDFMAWTLMYINYGFVYVNQDFL